MDHRFVEELIALLGKDGVRDRSRMDEVDPGVNPGNLGAGLLAQPSSTAEVQAIINLCQRRQITIVPQGGRTGLAGGAVSRLGELIVSTARLNAIEFIEAQEAVVQVGAGVTLEALDRRAAELDLTLGIDLAARGTATIGGMISTNAGGIEAFRNGMMRARVLGLEAVLPNGTVLNDLSRVTKVNEGLDVKQLLIGAEGTLGIITRAVLRLSPRPGPRATALVALADPSAAVRLYHRFRRAEMCELVAAEIMFADYVRVASADLRLERLAEFCEAQVYVLVEIAASHVDTASRALEEFLVACLETDDGFKNALIARSEAERREFWRLREDTWAIERQRPNGLWFDISVPLALISEYVSGLRERLAGIDPALGLYILGHLGDGNLHVTVATGERLDGIKDRVAQAVEFGLKACGGAISAEHGIGLDKRESLHREGDPGKLAAMRVIKAALDPHDLMNSGKIY